MNKTEMALLVAIVSMSACTSGQAPAVEDIRYQGDTVTVDANSPILTELKTATLEEELFSSEFRTVGSVEAENGHYAEVGVPFDGRISRSSAKLGKHVRAGESLFEMSSPDFLDISKKYLQNKREYERAKADYERKKSLSVHGITSVKDLEDAFTEAENARQEVESSEAILKVYGIDPASATLGQAMRIVAPISGEIVLNRVTPGAFISADSEPVITIADLRKVWVTAAVKERFIGSVTEGAKAEIFTEADPDDVIWGDILYVGNLVDDQTRSVQVVISCDNADMKLKHGMYVSVHFMSSPEMSIVVPSTALFQGKDRSYVFCCTENSNVFVKRYVETGAQDDDNTRICIKGGLKPGERIITEGGLYLND